jgi:hypothetical protein
LRVVTFLAAAIALSVSAAASAQTARPSLQDSFRLGNARGALCQMQSQGSDPAIKGMFDRSWAIVCRDAARPVGQVYALRDDAAATAGLSASRGAGVACEAGETATDIADVGRVSVMLCRLDEANVGYKIYRIRIGKVTYAAQGLAGYDSALELGLRTIVTDRTSPRRALPIPSLSRASRPARSIRRRRWPRAIAATMPATTPRPPNSSTHCRTA